MAYLGHKKRDSKEKKFLKRNLLNSANRKKLNF